ncbi:MAG: HD domain-containing protein [Bacteriovoracaceae bacterium]|nr:HD domain-containing protein [Bacteriovoracaceae bacterium]
MSDKFNEELYEAVPLKKFDPEKALCSDLYLKINNKYLKYRFNGDAITSEKYDLFLSKNVAEVFVLKEELETVLSWLDAAKQETIEEMVEEVGEENRELVEQREEIKEILYETFADEELNSRSVEVLQHQSKEFVALASEDKINKAIIAKLTKFNSSVADHSVNTANISVYLAMCCGFGAQYDLENIYMGALLHDYGKAKIPANILENKTNVRYSQAIQDHPNKGVGMIKKMKNIPEEVQMIVVQHHEQWNGNGFPKGLKEEGIYKFAMIVSMANIFNNIVEDEMQKKAMKEPNVEVYRKAIKVIEYDKGKQFNPEYIERACDGLKLSFGNYQK